MFHDVYILFHFNIIHKYNGMSSTKKGKVVIIYVRVSVTNNVLNRSLAPSALDLISLNFDTNHTPLQKSLRPQSPIHTPLPQSLGPQSPIHTPTTITRSPKPHLHPTATIIRSPKPHSHPLPQ